MTVFDTVRAALVADLTAPLAALGATVHPSFPSELTLPIAFASPPPDGTYVTPGPTYGGSFKIAVDLLVLVDHADAIAALASIEALIEAVLIHTADWDLIGVDAPAPASVTKEGAEFLSTVVHLTKTIHL